MQRLLRSDDSSVASRAAGRATDVADVESGRLIDVHQKRGLVEVHGTFKNWFFVLHLIVSSLAGWGEALKVPPRLLSGY